MIQVDGLIKQFGSLTAVDGVTFEAESGAIFGLLGPNGAGKTTTLGCISGLMKPTSGEVRVLGHNVVGDGTAARKSLGVVPQEIALYPELSATENLRYWGGAYGMSGDEVKRRMPGVLEWVGLEDRAKEPVKRFSGGMMRRLNFACGIIHEPKVLLLDEPTVGVDPQSRKRLLDLVREQAAAGTCVLYTTHYMEEAEQLCHRLAIIDHGKLVVQGSMAELRARTGERDILRLEGEFTAEGIAGKLAALSDTEVLVEDDKVLTLAVKDASRRLPEIFGAVSNAGGDIRETTLTQPSLESLFINLTGKELRE